MNKKFYLLKFLAMVFRISEIFIGIGIISTFILFPYATRIVEQRSGNLGIFVSGGTPGFNFTHGKSGFSWSSVEKDQSPALRPKLDPLFTNNTLFGRITLGRFRTNEGALKLTMVKKNGVAAEVDSLEGSFTFTFTSPDDAAAILDPIKWPFIFSFLCTGGITIAILESLSRMFRKVETGEIFAQTSIRHVQVVGFLFIASSLLKGFSAAWLKHAMAAVVMQQVATEAIKLDSSATGDSSSFITGLVILALAEVFRQGLKLKEENALTI